MHNYRYDKKVQDWIEIKQPKPSRFERKIWKISISISICVVVAVIVMVADAIAGGF